MVAWEGNEEKFVSMGVSLATGGMAARRGLKTQGGGAYEQTKHGYHHNENCGGHVCDLGHSSLHSPGLPTANVVIVSGILKPSIYDFLARTVPERNPGLLVSGSQPKRIWRSLGNHTNIPRGVIRC